MKMMKRICECGCGMQAGTHVIDKESNMRPDRYMFFGNLKTLKRAIDDLLEMDPAEIDGILADGHDWASDHIATSKDDVEEVYNFLVNRAGHQKPVIVHPQPHMIHTFESYLHESEDQDGDGDNDFADVTIARMIASGMSKEEAIKKSRKHNKK